MSHYKIRLVRARKIKPSNRSRHSHRGSVSSIASCKQFYIRYKFLDGTIGDRHITLEERNWRENLKQEIDRIRMENARIIDRLTIGTEKEPTGVEEKEFWRNVDFPRGPHN